MDDPSDDDRLLTAWHRGRDARAFSTLCERHAGLVGAACRRQGSPDVDAAAQAVFLVLARNAGRVQPATLAGWLTITARQIVAHQRRAAAARRHHEEAAAMEHSRQDATGDPDWTEARPLLDEALASLSPGRREAIVRFYLQGRPQAEVAAELNCSVDAVKTRVHEGIERLRGFFARRGVAIGTAALASGLGGEAAASDPVLAAACARAATPAVAPAAVCLAQLAGRSASLMAAAVALGIILAGVATAVVMAATTPAPARSTASWTDAADPAQDASALLAAMDGIHAAIDLDPAGQDLYISVRTIGFSNDLVTGTRISFAAGDGPRSLDLILSATTFSWTDTRGPSRNRAGPAAPGLARSWPIRGMRIVADPALDSSGMMILAYRMPTGAADPAPRIPTIEAVADAVVLAVSAGAAATVHPAPQGRVRCRRQPVTATDLSWHCGLAVATFTVDRTATVGLRGWIEAYSAGRQAGPGSAPTPLAERFSVFFREDGDALAFWLASGATVSACRLVKPPEDPIYARDPRFRPGNGHRNGFQSFPPLIDAMDAMGRIAVAVDWPESTMNQTRNQVEPTQAYRAMALRLTHGPDGTWVQPGQIRFESPAPGAAALSRVLELESRATADPPVPAGF